VNVYGGLYDSTQDATVQLSCTSTIGNIDYSDTTTFNLRGIYISDVSTDQKLVRSDDSTGTNLHVKVVDTVGNYIKGVLIGSTIGLGGFGLASEGNCIQEWQFRTEEQSGYATHGIWGFCCEGAPVIEVWIEKENNTEIMCYEGRNKPKAYGDLVIWLAGSGCYGASTTADPADATTGEGEVCHFERQAEAGMGTPGEWYYDECYGTLELLIFRTQTCCMVEIDSADYKPEVGYDVEFTASGNLLIGQNPDAIRETSLTINGEPFGYVIYVDTTNEQGSGGGPGTVSYSISELGIGGTHTFNFSEEYCLKIEVVSGSTPLNVGDSITLQAVGGCGSSWEWTFTGGEPKSGKTFTFVATSEQAGTDVDITVTDNTGDSATYTVTILAQATETETATPTPQAAPTSPPKYPRQNATPAPEK